MQQIFTRMMRVFSKSSCLKFVYIQLEQCRENATVYMKT